MQWSIRKVHWEGVQKWNQMWNILVWERVNLADHSLPSGLEWKQVNRDQLSRAVVIQVKSYSFGNAPRSRVACTPSPICPNCSFTIFPASNTQVPKLEPSQLIGTRTPSKNGQRPAPTQKLGTAVQNQCGSLCLPAVSILDDMFREKNISPESNYPLYFFLFDYSLRWYSVLQLIF